MQLNFTLKFDVLMHLDIPMKHFSGRASTNKPGNYFSCISPLGAST